MGDIGLVRLLADLPEFLPWFTRPDPLTSGWRLQHTPVQWLALQGHVAVCAELGVLDCEAFFKEQSLLAPQHGTVHTSLCDCAFRHVGFCKVGLDVMFSCADRSTERTLELFTNGCLDANARILSCAAQAQGQIPLWDSVENAAPQSGRILWVYPMTRKFSAACRTVATSL